MFISTRPPTSQINRNSHESRKRIHKRTSSILTNRNSRTIRRRKTTLKRSHNIPIRRNRIRSNFSNIRIILINMLFISPSIPTSHIIRRNKPRTSRMIHSPTTFMISIFTTSRRSAKISRPIRPISSTTTRRNRISISTQSTYIHTKRSSQRRQRSHNNNRNRATIVRISIRRRSPIRRSNISRPYRLLPTILLNRRRNFMTIRSYLSRRIGRMNRMIHMTNQVIGKQTRNRRINPHHTNNIFSKLKRMTSLPHHNRSPTSHNQKSKSFPQRRMQSNTSQRTNLTHRILSSSRILHSCPSLAIGP